MFSAPFAALAVLAAVSCTAPPPAPTTTPPTGGEARAATKTAPPNPYQRMSEACRRLADELGDRLPAGQPVAVLPLADDDGAVRKLGALAAEEIERRLLDRKIPVVDRGHLNAILREIDLQGALGDPNRIGQAGEVSGAETLIVGTLALAGREVLLSAQAVAVKGARKLAVAQPQSVDADGLGDLLWYIRRPTGRPAAGQLPPLSLRYEFFTPAGAGEARLDDGATVTSGQKFKVRVQPNSDCYLYVLIYDSQGAAGVLFPHGRIALGNAVRGGVSYEIPDGAKWYYFDEHPGAETLYLVASYTPLTGLDSLLTRMQQAGNEPKQLAADSRNHIDKVITRGMNADGAGDFSPKGLVIDRGVRIDAGPAASGDAKAIDRVVAGFATVVQRITVQHR